MKLNILLFFFISIFYSCTENNHKPTDKEVKEKSKIYEVKKHKNFNQYWYDGNAEITSYKLSQVRYGEIHEGRAVTIFVTEDFLPEKQVKADYQNEKNIPVLKLNSTKKFLTGVYPYSLMTSTFSPVDNDIHPLKITFSSQEWCGNTFMQLNNRKKFEIDFYSYFESNSDKKLSLEKNVLENSFWNLARINPYQIKKGRYKIIPSFEFLAFNHKKIKPYDAEVNLLKQDNLLNLTIYYPELKRKLILNLTEDFPFTIESWEEHILRGEKKLVTKAKKLEKIKVKYWNKNSNKDKIIREKLRI
jgi:hypothetical protein